MGILARLEAVGADRPPIAAVALFDVLNGRLDQSKRRVALGWVAQIPPGAHLAVIAAVGFIRKQQADVWSTVWPGWVKGFQVGELNIYVLERLVPSLRHHWLYGGQKDHERNGEAVHANAPFSRGTGQ